MRSGNALISPYMEFTLMFHTKKIILTSFSRICQISKSNKIYSTNKQLTTLRPHVHSPHI